MGITDRVLGKKNVNGKPHIEAVVPAAALPGGEVKLVGSGLKPPDLQRPTVLFGDIPASLVVSTDEFVVARVPEGANSGPVTLSINGDQSNPQRVHIAAALAEGIHPVANPAIDAEGNIYSTYSGQRGQKSPIAVFKIDTEENTRPFITDLMNATGLAFDREGYLYVSSRHDGAIYRVSPGGAMSVYAEGMGVATGIAFDKDENLYVGDRSGTIFKIARDRQIFVFTTLEPSVSAYHLAFGPDGGLFVTGPTTSSYDAIHRVDPDGTVAVFYRGLGRPQGLAFDADGNLYVAASHGGKRGIVRVTPAKEASLVLSGSNLVGLAFAPDRTAALTTTSAVYRIDWEIAGRPLL